MVARTGTGGGGESPAGSRSHRRCDRRRRDRRRRLHRALDRACAARARTRAAGHARRGGDLRPRAERPQRRLRPRLLGRAGLDAPGARRRASARARPGGGADHPGDPGLGRGSRRGRLAARGRNARGLGCAGAGQRRREGGVRRCAGGPGRPGGRADAGRGRAPRFLAGLPRRRLLSRVRDRPPGSARPRAAPRRARRGRHGARGDARDGRARRLAERDRDAGRDPPRAGGRARDERGAHRLGSGLPQPHQLRLVRRSDRAGAGGVGGDRLDRR